MAKITRLAWRGNTVTWEFLKMTAADEIVTGRDLSSLLLKTFKGFVIYSPTVNISES